MAPRGAAQKVSLSGTGRQVLPDGSTKAVLCLLACPAFLCGELGGKHSGRRARMETIAGRGGRNATGREYQHDASSTGLAARRQSLRSARSVPGCFC